MDVNAVGKIILERRNELEQFFVDTEQKGLKLVLDLISEASKSSADIESMLHIVSKIEDEAVYYDVILLKDQLGIATFEPSDTRPLVSHFLAISCSKAFGLYSNSELKIVSDQIANLDGLDLDKPIVQGLMTHVAHAFIASHEERRLVLFREVDTYASEITKFPENFLLYSKLELSLENLMAIDNRIYQISPLQKIKEEHSNLFRLLRSVSVTLHNDGKGFSGSGPKFFLGLQKKYLPRTTETTDQFQEDAAFFKNNYQRRSITQIVFFILLIAYCLPYVINNAKSWYVTDFGENRGVLVIKRITSHQGGILTKGDAIWSINNIVKPSLVEFSEELTNVKNDSVSITINRNGLLQELAVPIIDSEPGRKIIGVTFYTTSFVSKLWLAWFVIFLPYTILLTLSYFVPIFGVIAQTAIPLFSIATLLLLLINTGRILDGLAGDRPIWGIFMLLCSAAIVYASYKGLPILVKWKPILLGRQE